jgi:chromosome segregation ATPase
MQQLQDKLSTLEVGVTATQPISGVYETTKEQKDDADRVVNSLKQQEPVYEKIMEIGQALLESSPEETDIQPLKEELNALTSKWQDVTNKANTRGESLNNALPLAKSYSTAQDDFGNWLSEAERKLESTDEMPLDVENIEKVQQRLTEIAEDVQAHEGVYDEYVAMTAKVVDVCEDVVVIETEAKDVERRWNELKNKVEVKKADAERVKEILTKHHQALEDIETVNDKMADIVNSKDLYKLDGDKLKETLEKAKV